MTDTRHARNARVHCGLITLAGFATLVVGLLFGERLLAPFISQPGIKPISARYVHMVRICYVVFGGLLAALGIVLARIVRFRAWQAARPRAANIASLVLTDICTNVGTRPVFFTESRLITQVSHADLEKQGRCRTSISHSPETAAGACRQCDSLPRPAATEEHAGYFDHARTVRGVGVDYRDPIHLEPSGSAAVAASTADYLATLLKKRENRS